MQYTIAFEALSRHGLPQSQRTLCGHEVRRLTLGFVLPRATNTRMSRLIIDTRVAAYAARAQRGEFSFDAKATSYLLIIPVMSFILR